MLTADDEAALAQQDFETLATAWSIFNGWDWPEWMPDEEVKPQPWTPDTRRGAAMRWIENAIGMRACYRYSRPWKDSTEEEFNDFWRGCFEGHEPSRQRYYKRIEDQVRPEIARRSVT